MSTEIKNLHICFVTKNAPSTTGPNEQGHILPLARQIVKMGHKVTILTWKMGPKSESSQYAEDNIEILFLGVGHFKTLSDFPELAANRVIDLHQLEPIDIVHSLDTPLPGLKKNFPRKKRFALSYGVEVTSMMEVFTKFSKTYASDWSSLRSMISSSLWFLQRYFAKDYGILKQADGIFVTSPKQSMALDRYYLYPSLRTYQIPLSLATGVFPKKDKNTELMQSLDLDYKSQVIVARNDMEDIREMVFLLEAFEKVAIKKPRARLLVIGDGPFLKQAERRSLELAIGERVHFLGKLPRKKYIDYIALGNIFIQLTARTSGLGQSLFEAMAQEKTVIGSEFSPISYFIEDKKQGYLIRPGEKEKLTQLIISIFEHPGQNATLGQNARTKVIKHFDRKTIAAHTCHAFGDIISRRKTI